eukprot:TRINITY_DN89680_c0_g1_i1.p1 TRINITY_DN89680_c0_g1~~TRINITY_DN89680_c0_g1_i1.p1  ORF type:complete len:143 (-),score=12.60 TRINITY_DN89680_c0_g1_i1:60-488(-)
MFWNFPDSGASHWHRDGELPLLTAATVAFDYPENAGHLQIQPYTHEGALDEDSESLKEPKPERGESSAVPVVLRRGETVLFLYSAKHAATPNFADVERCLLYSVYGPVGTRDDVNIKESRPSLSHYTKSDAELLLMLADNLA